MPRIIDKLDAAAGRTPVFLDLGIDYSTPRPGPKALIKPDGTYEAGWFHDFDGDWNLDDSSAFDIALQRWVHLTFDAPDHFIVCNLANLTRASNTALLVANKRTGEFHHASLTHLYPQDTVRVEPPFTHWRDSETGSFVRIGDDLSVELAINADGLHFVATARHALGPPLIQASRFQRGRGAIQWYRILELERGLLAVGDRVVELPAGTMGTCDRTIGHQRGVQAWNWVAGVGTAVDLETGERTRLGVQIAKDRHLARPQVPNKKYLIWTEDRLFKLGEVDFSYEHGSDWRIHGDDLDFRFVPAFHRHEEKRLVLVRADFHQFYGELSGTVRVGGRRLRLEPCFAVTEESLLEL
ncbi:MAG TPA: DUF2804 family protein [Myxococcota bacterium]|nr:DUF2804 family protein [Myxococcota bacterium]